jgi:hypothetical protein
MDLYEHLCRTEHPVDLEIPEVTISVSLAFSKLLLASHCRRKCHLPLYMTLKITIVVSLSMGTLLKT